MDDEVGQVGQWQLDELQCWLRGRGADRGVVAWRGHRCCVAQRDGKTDESAGAVAESVSDTAERVWVCGVGVSRAECTGSGVVDAQCVGGSVAVELAAGSARAPHESTPDTAVALGCAMDECTWNHIAIQEQHALPVEWKSGRYS